jgi:hypothetical protein
VPFSKKNVQFAAAAGRRGAVRRWQGHQRLTVKLAALTPGQRRIILAVLQDDRADGQ